MRLTVISEVDLCGDGKAATTYNISSTVELQLLHEFGMQKAHTTRNLDPTIVVVLNSALHDMLIGMIKVAKEISK